MSTLYDELSAERKRLQAEGMIPEWMTTGGWQTLKPSLWNAVGVKDTYERIAKTAANRIPNATEEVKNTWAERFFEILWKGWLACSTPVISNMGTDKGMPVSCSGGYVDDSIYGFYDHAKEVAVLTKNGFGTSGYLGDIRPRGSKISTGGKSNGVLQVVKNLVEVTRDVAQGGNDRRGAWAGYVPLWHGDFYEVAAYLEKFPDDCNIGWIIDRAFVARLNAGDKDANARFSRIMQIRALTGKGYILKIDHVNEQNPAMYAEHGLKVKASNLCVEIALHSDVDHTFTCVLSSMNIAKYDEWKNTDAVFVATVFLDCVAEEFIQMGKHIKGMEAAVRFTEKSRALGLGALGFHTYLQQNMIPFESFEAHMMNKEIFCNIKASALSASAFMANEWGEPEWCKGYGVRNTHLLAVAPNTSSALMCGGVSQGIEPVVAISYNQPTAKGNIKRLNPVFLDFCKTKGIEVTEEFIKDIDEHKGSIQHLTELFTQHERDVFKTAFEIDQMAIVRLASARQTDICQAQSLNLFFDADEEEAYIAQVHRAAIEDENIKSLYYMRTMAGVSASKGECAACQG